MDLLLFIVYKLKVNDIFAPISGNFQNLDVNNDEN